MTARAIGGRARWQLALQDCGEAVLAFLTISHTSLAAPLRVVSDGKDYRWQGEDWIGFPFELALLTDSEAPPRATLTVQNVDRRIGDALQGLTSAARVRIDMVMASEFDLRTSPRTPLGTPIIAYSANHLFLVNVSVNALQASGDLVSWNYTQDTWPGRRATQDVYPALYR